MLRVALYGFALLCLFVRRELLHVTVCVALLVEGSCHTLRFAQFLFTFVCFVLLVGGERNLSHVTILFALLCFVSLCIPLFCFALHCLFVE